MARAAAALDACTVDAIGVDGGDMGIDAVGGDEPTPGSRILYKIIVIFLYIKMPEILGSHALWMT